MVCADTGIRPGDPRALRRSVRPRGDGRAERLGSRAGRLSRAVRPARSDAAQHVSRHAAGLRHRPQGPRGREERQQGLDRGLLPEQKQFLSLPFSHSERLADQARAGVVSQPAWTRPWSTCVSGDHPPVRAISIATPSGARSRSGAFLAQDPENYGQSVERSDRLAGPSDQDRADRDRPPKQSLIDRPVNEPCGPVSLPPTRPTSIWKPGPRGHAPAQRHRDGASRYGARSATPRPCAIGNR